MKYLLLIYGDEHALSEAERQACYAESAALARDLDQAVDIAAMIPMAREGTVEVRPVVEVEGLPR